MDEFAASGYNGTSLARIAERAGLTQQGLLHYFPSKQDLLVAVLNRRDELDSPIVRGGEDGPEGEERLARGREGLLEVVRRNTERTGIVQAYAVLSAESVPEGHPAHDYFRERFRRLRGEVAAMLRAECGEELPSGATPEEAAALVIATLDGLQVQWLHDPESVDMPALVERLMDTLTRA